MPDRKAERDEAVVSESKPKLKKPPLFKVLLHNDDYTTMDFVVLILRGIFQHSEHDAIRIMLQVHQQGVGIAGVFTYEIAETKIAKVIALAQENGYPLLCTMEAE